MNRRFVLALNGIDGLWAATAQIESPLRGQVLVRMHAASLNFRDLLVARRRQVDALPLVPLSDGAGEVIEVGQGVTRWTKGDRVVGTFYQSWIGGQMTAADLKSALGGASMER